MLVLLSGVSGAGKDTIKNELIKRMDNVVSMPSYTDRQPREGEVNGQIYNFITTQEFEERIKNNEFYEYSVHHEHYYGTSKEILNKMNLPENTRGETLSMEQFAQIANILYEE